MYDYIPHERSLADWCREELRRTLESRSAAAGRSVDATPVDGPVVVEINPRLSGGLALTQHAGADLLGAYVDRALGRPIDRDSLRARPGVRMARHFVEVFEPCD